LQSASARLESSRFEVEHSGNTLAEAVLQLFDAGALQQPLP
jgi:hypothetical protein